MKTFEDLKFTPHLTGEGLQGRIFFENGYGVSVVRFKLPMLGASILYGSYTSNENEWELAILYGNEEDGWELTYTTPITNDVMGHLTAADVTEIMAKVQQLPK